MASRFRGALGNNNNEAAVRGPLLLDRPRFREGRFGKFKTKWGSNFLAEVLDRSRPNKVRFSAVTSGNSPLQIEAARPSASAFFINEPVAYCSCVDFLVAAFIKSGPIKIIHA